MVSGARPCWQVYGEIEFEQVPLLSWLNYSTWAAGMDCVCTGFLFRVNLLVRQTDRWLSRQRA